MLAHCDCTSKTIFVKPIFVNQRVIEFLFMFCYGHIFVLQKELLSPFLISHSFEKFSYYYIMLDFQRKHISFGVHVRNTQKQVLLAAFIYLFFVLSLRISDLAAKPKNGREQLIFDSKIVFTTATKLVYCSSVLCSIKRVWH